MNWKGFKGSRPLIIVVLSDHLSELTEEHHGISVRLRVPRLESLQARPRTTLGLCRGTRPHGDKYQDSGLLGCDDVWSG